MPAYAVAFGGYVAFSVYLPAYLKTAHQLTPADAANRMAGFVLVAVIMRPVGGWLADKLGGGPGARHRLRGRRLCAGVSAGPRRCNGIGTLAFLAMAAALGSGSGATFALIAKVTDPSRVGGVTGLVVPQAAWAGSSRRSSWATSTAAPTPTPSGSGCSASPPPSPCCSPSLSYDGPPPRDRKLVDPLAQEVHV